jgi:hypothetical protein
VNRLRKLLAAGVNAAHTSAKDLTTAEPLTPAEVPAPAASKPPISTGYAPRSVSPDTVACGPAANYPCCPCCSKYPVGVCTVKHDRPCNRRDCEQQVPA